MMISPLRFDTNNVDTFSELTCPLQASKSQMLGTSAPDSEYIQTINSHTENNNKNITDTYRTQNLNLKGFGKHKRTLAQKGPE